MGEEQRPAGDSFEPATNLSVFWKLSDIDPNTAIIPVGELPIEYRKSIDKGFSTGWSGLDKYLQGIRMGEMTVVTADTGAGKTTFCTHIMVNAAMQGIPVWINSWEMKPVMILRKIASIVLRRPLKCVDFTEEESKIFDNFASRHKVYVNPQTIWTNIDELEEQLKCAKMMGVKLVMLDHLDYLVNTRKEKLHEAIDETVKRLHELAFSLEMHFLLICHPRQTMTGSEEVGMHSLKGSSAIKQYADNIIILHRCARTDTQADPTKVKVRVAKNRMFGIEGNTYLYYVPMWDGYEELGRVSNG